MPRQGPQGLKRLTLDLSPEMHRGLKVRAAEAGVTMVDLIRHLLADVLDDPRRFSQAAARAQQAKDTR